ncbi:hypothetical protein [Roseomonas marmotae]|uniref:Uncharacterized protein n=1 Tax=Roseomonas marmotae TaxID=2768161 RepID=A0ABS3K7D7_9PROT|nr:hypothetical protein [Roseomonas marmotae]MBO1073393.1 hypothetical protein [Roseomonas marmotae]QTI80408.1 hypothetical protein IAI58_06610 [Roseomonas marmotae]
MEVTVRMIGACVARRLKGGVRGHPGRCPPQGAQAAGPLIIIRVDVMRHMN